MHAFIAAEKCIFLLKVKSNKTKADSERMAFVFL